MTNSTDTDESFYYLPRHFFQPFSTSGRNSTTLSNRLNKIKSSYPTIQTTSYPLPKQQQKVTSNPIKIITHCSLSKEHAQRARTLLAGLPETGPLLVFMLRTTTVSPASSGSVSFVRSRVLLLHFLDDELGDHAVRVRVWRNVASRGIRVLRSRNNSRPALCNYASGCGKIGLERVV